MSSSTLILLDVAKEILQLFPYGPHLSASQNRALASLRAAVTAADPQLAPRFVIGRSSTNGFTTFADGDLFEHHGRLYKLCSSGYGWTLRPLIPGTNRANYGEHLDGWLDLPSAMALIVKLNQAAADAEPLPELPWHEASALRCKQCKTPYVKHSTCGCQYCPACWLSCPRCGGQRR